MKAETSLPAPPSEPVRWVVWDRDEPEHVATVEAQLWFRARELGVEALGVPFDRIEAEQERKA